MSAFKALFFLFIIFGASSCEAYRILAIFPFSTKSHNIFLTAIAKSLAQHDHQVDVITGFVLKNPPKNYNVVVNLSDVAIPFDFTYNFTQKIATDYSLDTLTESYGKEICDYMGLERMRKFIQRVTQKPGYYDIVLVEVFGANCYLGFGHLLKVPVIAASSTVEYPWISNFIGNDDNLAYVPNPYLNSFDKTKFVDRLKNFISHHWFTYQFQSKTEKSQTDSMRKYLSPDIPNIRDVERSVALTFVNRHPILYGVKPIIPSLVEISGVHIEKSSKLSKNLQNWLDKSPEGVVYFSFGSMVMIESLPSQVLKSFYESFSKLRQKVLIRVTDAEKLPPGLPSNVLTLPWIPQQAVLGHKNVKLFITHGGMLSCLESLHFAVPMIGIPLFGDQSVNIQRFVEKNMAIRLDMNNITTATLSWTLNEILTNQDYRKKSLYFSRLFHDRPMTPQDAIRYWVEFVIRNGPDALRSPALELHWWQLALLDVYSFLLFLAIAVSFFIYYLGTHLFQCLSVNRKIKIK